MLGAWGQNLNPAGLGQHEGPARAGGDGNDHFLPLLPRLVQEGIRNVSPNGVLGDPTGACAKEGEELLDDAIGELVDLVDAWPQARTARAG